MDVRSSAISDQLWGRGNGGGIPTPFHVRARVRIPPTTGNMDVEEQTGLLATTPEHLDTVKVFPLIPHILRDVTVRAISNTKSTEVTLNVSTRSL